MPQAKQAPYAAATLLHALEEHLYPPQVIIVRGIPQEMDAWQQALSNYPQVRRLIFCIPNDLTDLPGVLSDKTGDASQTRAYVCSGMQCLAPVTSSEELIKMIR